MLELDCSNNKKGAENLQRLAKMLLQKPILEDGVGGRESFRVTARGVILKYRTFFFIYHPPP